jgi:hypothetical protein
MQGLDSMQDFAEVIVRRGLYHKDSQSQTLAWGRAETLFDTLKDRLALATRS